MKTGEGMRLWTLLALILAALAENAGAAGMIQLTNNPSGSSFPFSASPKAFLDANGTLYFAADDGINGSELWKSDGTVAGTVMVKDINPAGSSSPAEMVFVNGVLYFAADDGSNGRELWRSDGTDGGTFLLKDIRPGGDPSQPSGLTAVNGEFYFSAIAGLGLTLWKSDGTNMGTYVVKPSPTASLAPEYLTEFNGKIVFWGTDSAGIEPWISDGTDAGTFLLKDINPPSEGNPNQFYRYGPDLYFKSRNNGQHGLWKTDGTPNGTVLIKEVNLYTDYADLNGLFYFGTIDSFFQSDGTSNGTVVVRDYDNSFQLASNLVRARDLMFMRSSTSSLGNELWISDGTAAHTAMVKDVRPGFNGSAIASITAVPGNQVVLFTAHDGTSFSALYRSDGTDAGTWNVTTAIGGPNLQFVRDIIFLGSHVFFTAQLTGGDRELYSMPISLIDEAKLSVSSPSLSESTGGTQLAAFTVALSKTLPNTVTVEYSTGALSATPGADFKPLTGTLTFNPGELSKSINVEVITDSLNEDDETFSLALSNPVGAAIDPGLGALGTATIVNDDPLPALSIADLSVSEGAGQATLSVSLSAASGRTVAVSFNTTDSSAFAPVDYSAQSGTLTFLPGQTLNQIVVPLVDNQVETLTKSFNVSLNTASNATILDSTAICSITDNDAPTFSVSDASAAELDVGTAALSFTVSLSAPSINTLSVDYATQDGAATASSLDYVSKTGPLTFLPGDIFKTVLIAVNGDELAEPDESLSLRLSNAIGTSIGSAVGVGTIVNDDSAPVLQSAISVNPSPVQVLQSVSFGVAGMDGDGDTLSVSIDYGDGSSGNALLHTYVLPGNYTALAHLSDGVNVSHFPFSVIVSPAPAAGSGDPDSDADGFSDALEVAFGTLAFDSTSTPYGGKPVDDVQALTISKMGTRLSFIRSGKDSILVSGTLPLADGFVLEGQSLLIDVGGVTQLMTFDRKGAFRSGTNIAKIRIKAKKGVVLSQDAPFQFKLSGSFSQALSDEGLTGVSSVRDQARQIKVTLIFDKRYFYKNQSQLYSSVMGKSGKSK
jgi:ELWxxDGT repeat protein